VTPDSRSILTRSARPPDRSFAYGALPDQVADAWLPREQPNRTLLIFLHGGFWRDEYDRAHVAPLAEAFADLGYTVVTPEYRRTGGAGGYPATLDDVRAAVSAAVDQFTLDRTIVAGHSAGGHLALWVAGEVAVTGVVGLAPVADLVATYQLDLDAGAVHAFLGGGPAEVPERYAAADPMQRLPVGVPVRLVHGDADQLVPISFSQRYADAAAAAGDRIRLEVAVGSGHFALIDPQSAAWPAVVDAVATVAPRDRER